MLINMQSIVDHFESTFPGELQFAQSWPDSAHLQSARFFTRDAVLCPDTVYIAHTEELSYLSPELKGICFITIGDMPKLPNCSVLAISPGHNRGLPETCNRTQEVFDSYNAWNAALQHALVHDLGIEELLNLSVDIFHNPLFVHNPDFYIVASTSLPANSLKWELDENSQRNMVSSTAINHYKIDPDYLESLKSNGAHIFPANFRSYRILYVNIRSNDRYEGRLCINELESPLQPSQFFAAEHLVSMIQIAMSRDDQSRALFSGSFEIFLEAFLNRNIGDERLILDRIHMRAWNRHDNYVCIKFGLDKRDIDVKTVASNCNEIAKRITGSFAFSYKNNILVLVNLTFSASSRGQVLNQLAELLREGLFKAGASQVYDDFFTMPDHYQLASIALEEGSKSDSTSWYYCIEDYILPHLLAHGYKESSPHIYCEPSLKKLKEYDSIHQTEFFPTLRIFLECDKSAVRTARALFIHRSTLLYRLDRIREIVKLELEDPHRVLWILLSYQLFEKAEKDSERMKLIVPRSQQTTKQ